MNYTIQGLESFFYLKKASSLWK